MKLCHVTITVRSLEESLRFYQEIIGLTLNRRFSTGAGWDIAFLSNGETEIELLYNPADKDVVMGQGISLGFEVESMGEAVELLNRKDIEHGELIQLGAEAQCVFLADPNGVRVQLIEYFK